MFSITTAEIRWFQLGSSPGIIRKWLRNQKGIYEEQETRTDVYLILKNNPALGIKLREGRMEIKKRLSVGSTVRSHNLAGTSEVWKKWSAKTEESNSAGNLLFEEEDHWIHIRKKRYLQKYEITSGGELIPYPESGFPNSGLAVEIADLVINDQQWWTFGLESFGNPDQVKNDLESFLPQLVRDLPCTHCHTNNSFSYPQWISSFK